MRLTIKRALISVSDKTQIDDLAKALVRYGVEILATGGTADRLKRAGVQYRAIETFTGNPEAFDGRMKTLSFKLESAILFDRSNNAHVTEASQLGIEPIDLVVCNFYPFEQAVLKGSTEEELIEEIDVGGPTMVRAAAKNFKSVLVLTDPSDYEEVLTEMRQLSGQVSLETRKRMMLKAFERVSWYDQAIYDAFSRKKLRYGENPHQEGYFVPDGSVLSKTWDLLEPSGVELSYNNILDAQAALSCVRDVHSISPTGFGACAIVKHNNPCGLATAPTIEDAFMRAWAGDPVSAFGGVVAFSAPLTSECARLFDEKFVEVVIAPDYEPAALEELKRKKKKLRILKLRVEDNSVPARRELQRTRVEGGTLVQWPDEGVKEEFKTVTQKRFPSEMVALGRFGVVASKWIKSNAISITRVLPDGGFQMVGMGSGQPNRVDAIRKLALPKALDVLKATEKDVKAVLGECILTSDAFFPFPDNIEEAYGSGIRYVVQPGGSIRDAEVIAACDKLGVAMAFTGKRHFRH